MPFKLMFPTDLAQGQLDILFARANEITRGATSDLKSARVALALFNTSFPLPLHTEQILREAGAQVIPIASSIKLDEISRTINAANVNMVIFSHPETGAAHELGETLNVSLLNAGDGTRENPVRGLMDAFAIYTLKGNLDQIRVALLGNLKFSAEAHSLALLLGMFGARLTFVSPAALSMPYDLTDQVRLSAYEVEETNDLSATLRKTDALYLANIDPVRVEKKIFDKHKGFYTLTPETFAGSKDGIVVLGEWDGAQNLLASTRPHIERAARAMLLALIKETER